jgi:hypothetical protein
VFEDKLVASYLLQTPSLNVLSNKKEGAPEDRIILSLTSTINGASKSCEIAFNSKYVASGTRNEYLVQRHSETEYEYDDEARPRNIYLDTQYVGANLLYSVEDSVEKNKDDKKKIKITDA